MVYYDRAKPGADYPHVSFNFARVGLADLSRQDYTIIIDLWDRGESAVAVEDMADNIEAEFNNANNPTTDILPTFFIEAKRTVLDEDKLIRHKQLEIVAQNYEV